MSYITELLEMLKQVMKLYLNYEEWMKHLKKNLGVHYKNGDIVLLKDTLLLSETI